ncbi:type III-D CRISPR-associated protein Csx19 [Nocardia abscessus]|uniref:type III-D CRISPR-associated protein Csx19 n=1 Tax=Nocardia abscessus TaxID=120957 RepID=UPI002458528D|nr:CRISPR-associated protein Csx19 [Nocardia abscessus]
MTDQHSPPAHLAATRIGDAPTAVEALAAFADHTDLAGAVGFAYTPTAAPWLAYTDDGWHTRAGESAPRTAFELRAFTPTAELRWWRDSGADTGTAVVLTETLAPPSGDPAVRLQPGERSLLLWGSVIDTVDGWANLADPRIGDILWIPLPEAVAGSAVRLRMVDYATTDIHGNLAVIEQRLTRLTQTSHEATTVSEETA